LRGRIMARDLPEAEYAAWAKAFAAGDPEALNCYPSEWSASKADKESKSVNVSEPAPEQNPPSNPMRISDEPPGS